jgi:hypothetical protein
MSSNNSKLENLNKHFEEYIESVKSVQENIKEEAEYHRGYIDCMKLVIDSISSPEDTPEWLKPLRQKIEMDERSKVVSELMNGITPVMTLYKKLSSEK